MSEDHVFPAAGRDALSASEDMLGEEAVAKVPPPLVAVVLALRRFPDGIAAASLRVAGLSVLERSLFLARDMGAQRAIVVATALAAEHLRPALWRTDLRLEVTFADASTAATSKALPENAEVLIVSADAVIGHQAARAVKESPRGQATVFLSEGTPGKSGIPLPHGGSWLGVARVPRDLAVRLLLALQADPEEGAVKVLSEALSQGKATSVTVEGVASFFMRAPADVPLARRALFRALGKKQDGWVSRTLNRPISTVISRLLVETSVTPNLISVGVFFLRLGACALIAWGGPYLHPLIGFTLLQLASILDGCDGELARVRYQSSVFGARLDTALDHTATLVLNVALAANIVRNGGSILFAVMAGITVVGGIIAMAAMFAYMVKIGSGSGYDVPGLPPLADRKSVV